MVKKERIGKNGIANNKINISYFKKLLQLFSLFLPIVRVNKKKKDLGTNIFLKKDF